MEIEIKGRLNLRRAYTIMPRSNIPLSRKVDMVQMLQTYYFLLHLIPF